MSKFTTTIPVSVEAVTGSMPKGSFLNEVKLGDDKKSVVIEWENDDYKTPFTGPVELSPLVLEGKEPLPATVKPPQPVAGCKKVQNDEVAPKPARKAKPTQ